MKNMLFRFFAFDNLELAKIAEKRGLPILLD